MDIKDIRTEIKTMEELYDKGMLKDSRINLNIAVFLGEIALSLKSIGYDVDSYVGSH